MSLRQKAILGIGLTYAAIVTVFAFSAFKNEQKIVKEEMMNTSMGCTRLFAKMVTKPLLNNDIAAIKMHVQQAAPMVQFSHGRNVSYVIVQDDTEHVVASSGTNHLDQFLRGEINQKAFMADSEMVQDIGSIVDVAIPIFANGVKKGVVRLGISTKDIEAKILHSRRWALQFMLGATFLGAMLGLFIDHTVKGDLSNLIETAARMADGDLNQRVNIKTGDEMEAFGVAFNKMADKLHEAHENLEQKVAERTRELRESQTQLVHQEKMASFGVRELVNFWRPAKSELRPAQINDLVRTALGKRIKGVDNATMKSLLSYDWKGNIRELENVVERAMILCDGEFVTTQNLPAALTATNHTLAVDDALKKAMKKYERDHILKILTRTGNNKRQAAKLLGISESSLYRKMEALKIPFSIKQA